MVDPVLEARTSRLDAESIKRKDEARAENTHIIFFMDASLNKRRAEFIVAERREEEGGKGLQEERRRGVDKNSTVGPLVDGAYFSQFSLAETWRRVLWGRTIF